MKVIFSHGKESGPWGSKIKSLAEIAKSAGFEVDSIDYTLTYNPDERVDILSSYLAKETDDFVLVGSSMGGYVSLVNAMELHPKGLFLLAPALFMPNYAVQHYKQTCHTEIVHGWSDTVIPIEHSIQFGEKNKTTLHLIDGDHSLSSSLPTIEPLFNQFLIVCKGT
ncbi:YqiA/YcfP family alpha/beta fold hydrolase [Alteromonas facilis]|uniref:YqiA/YcfP family alpha/beta fold hydrolase n=1 Tax=Alteromonas facilis TaxID=2048004 RepID=UPI001F0CD2C6|nr:alpha/beta hydrolase [Alteromonas facilis]